MQSKRHSIIEACSNVFSGMVIAFVISQLAHMYSPEIRQYIWKGFEWKVSVGSNAVMTVILTVISIVRGYLWRRHFNRVQEQNYKGENNG
jgi:ABC-type spermidine/putrescine transport system permease subunit I